MAPLFRSHRHLIEKADELTSVVFGDYNVARDIQHGFHRGKRASGTSAEHLALIPV